MQTAHSPPATPGVGPSLHRCAAPMPHQGRAIDLGSISTGQVMRCLPDWLTCLLRQVTGEGHQVCPLPMTQIRQVSFQRAGKFPIGRLLLQLDQHLADLRRLQDCPAPVPHRMLNPLRIETGRAIQGELAGTGSSTAAEQPQRLDPPFLRHELQHRFDDPAFQVGQ